MSIVSIAYDNFGLQRQEQDPACEPIPIYYRGKWYMIDVSPENSKRWDETMQPWVEAAEELDAKKGPKVKLPIPMPEMYIVPRPGAEPADPPKPPAVNGSDKVKSSQGDATLFGDHDPGPEFLDLPDGRKLVPYFWNTPQDAPHSVREEFKAFRKTIKDWLAANGHDVSARGQMSRELAWVWACAHLDKAPVQR